MIGKPEWFKRRKYGGWGITPAKWQGWLYIIVLILPLIIFQALGPWERTTRIVVTLAWLAFVGFDVIDIMSKIKNDERDKKIEALAERNAAWIMVAVLAVAVVYQAITSALSRTIAIDWFLLAALFLGVAAKAISNFVLERGEL